MSDDLAMTQWPKGRQKAPLIVPPAAPLEGVWHSGSPMGMILGSLRASWCACRALQQAAGMYNTLLQSDDPRW